MSEEIRETTNPFQLKKIFEQFCFLKLYINGNRNDLLVKIKNGFNDVGGAKFLTTCQYRDDDSLQYYFDESGTLLFTPYKKTNFLIRFFKLFGGIKRCSETPLETIKRLLREGMRPYYILNVSLGDPCLMAQLYGSCDYYTFYKTPKGFANMSEYAEFVIIEENKRAEKEPSDLMR